jgi:hypothetical protein
MQRNSWSTLIFFVFAEICAVSSVALGGSGIFQALLPINEYDDGAFSGMFYDLTFFNGKDFGTINVASGEYVNIGGGEIHTYKNGGSDVTGAQIYWRVYPSDQLPGAFQAINLPFFDEYPAFGGNPGDQRWLTATSFIDIVHGRRDGNYTLEVWAQATSSDGTHYDNNCGCNLKATYNIVGSGIATTVSVNNASIEAVQGISFQSVSNVWYELQSSPAVTGTWKSSGVRLLGNGEAMSFFDPTGYSTQKFYRVFVLP